MGFHRTKYSHRNVSVRFATGIQTRESRHLTSALLLLRNLFSILRTTPNLHGAPAKQTEHPRQRRIRCMRHTHGEEFWVPLQSKLLLLEPIVQSLCYELRRVAISIQWHVEIHVFHLAIHAPNARIKIRWSGAQYSYATIEQFRPFR